MCGIIGYIGKNNGLPIVLNGLKILEYRGYDSSGIAYIKDNKIKIVKEVGKIANLEKKLPNDKSNIVIGHTRWATHGKANTINAHPHQVGDITLVHNGIIENYNVLKKWLEKQNYVFKSETDTEIVAGLLDYYYKKDKNAIKAINKVIKKIKGSYALGIVFNGINKLYAIRNLSPLIIGIAKDGLFLASDVPAILNYTKDYLLLENNEICELDMNKYYVTHDNKEIKKNIFTYDDVISNPYKDGYKHYMLKEINEETLVVNNLISIILNQKTIDLKKYDNIQIVACGSAYHAGLVGKYLIEEYLNIKVDCYLASEYRYGKVFYNAKTLFIAISQSGETADTLASLRLAKEKGIYTLGIINTVLSSIAREVDEVLYINAGIEMAVATTKAYVLQILMFSLLVYKSMCTNNLISKEEKKNILKDLKRLPKRINKVLKIRLNQIANELYKKEDIYFIGRQVDYALSLEASLKLKEISYIHSDAYAAGELKHGTISLIEKNTPVIGIITDKNVSEKIISNLKEVKARDAKVYIIVNEKIEIDKSVYDKKIVIPDTLSFTNNILAIIPMQLLAYKVALKKNCDIDKPRNLAKSVTVE